jgi:hypothetical protein
VEDSDDGWAVLDRRVVVAKVIEFYIPVGFRKKFKWIPRAQRGKMIEFPADLRRKSA